MKRRDFLGICAAMALTPLVPGRILADVAGMNRRRSLAPLNIKNITINVDCEKPFSALHISDTHLSYADLRDNERKIKLAAGRQRYFPFAEHYLDCSIEYAKSHGMQLIHTGDLIDFTSEANFDHASAHLMEGGALVSAGNHEFSQYVGEAKEDAAYKAATYKKVQEVFPNDLTFYSKIINGVNFVAIDNVYYNITENQHELVEKEMKKGLPVILLCHVPLYSEEILDFALELGKGCANLVGCPESVTSKFPGNPDLPESEQWRNRSVQQKADKPTLEFVKWLRKQKMLKGILCGHWHKAYEARFSPTAMQYVAPANFEGKAYAVDFRKS